MDHELRRIGPDDWQLFREVRLRSLAEAPAAFGSRYEDWVDAPEERWRARLTDVPLTLLALSGDTVVGVASGAPEGDDAVALISMWVAPEVRGTGVAADLVQAVVDWAHSLGRSTFLMVRSDNARAIAAYVRAGFTDRGVPEDWPSDQPLENLMEHEPRRRPGGAAGLGV